MIRGIMVSLEQNADADAVMHAIRMLRGVRAIMGVGDAMAVNIEVDQTTDVQLKIPKFPRAATYADVTEVVSSYFRLPKAKFVELDRHKAVAHARHVAMYLCYKRAKVGSYPDVARAFRRDHTTVMAAVEKVERKIRTDPEFKETVDTLIGKLQQRTGTNG
jgi:chromosomal replication initiation ATPase DnaA